ncbi:MAG: excinuclease ABC subunit UvrB [Bdellovibrionota bacterium]
MGSAKIKKPKVKNTFELEAPHKPAGDQPRAIKELVTHVLENPGHSEQVLLGATGTGKTFTVANMIQQLNLPAIVLAPNKTLAAQLFAEFKELFPRNSVEYFVSYYDYYQPEAYLPGTDTYIEKDSAINEQIDKMRHSATRSLLEKKDVIIVSSVSCIYGIGSPETYKAMTYKASVNQAIKRDQFLRELIRIQYQRNDLEFTRGTIRVRGDIVEVYPPSEDERAVRLEFFGDYIEKISWVDPLRGITLEEVSDMTFYPNSHYVSTEEIGKRAVKTIQAELGERLNQLKGNMKLLEAQRLEQRTYYDIEMMEELGYCQGIENYSRHLTGRGPGEPPPTLLEYFPAEFLCFIDESHITVPQIGGMYRGDRSRKMTLVEHGFRLPSALDNRPLNFQEFEKILDKVVYVSATPGPYELQKTGGLFVEQIIRPTGLLDPQIEIRKATHQVDDLLGEIKKRVARKERVLVTTLTKKSSEDLAEYYAQVGVKVKYLHSEIKTVERTEILRDLRLGIFDVLVGINLLREGLDIPEVSLVAILDADKEGFLRSERSLIQTIGRAARNDQGRVIMYADRETDSMKKAIGETTRRRETQAAYNLKHGITPVTIKKAMSKGLTEHYGADFFMNIKDPEKRPIAVPKDIKELRAKIDKLKKDMKKEAKNLEFEAAANMRDEIKRLELLELKMLEGGPLGEET